jgi:hypothetical protein
MNIPQQWRSNDVSVSGFEPDPEPECCRHPEHNPPTHLCIPSGQRYRHVCPSCGAQAILRSASIYL